MESTLNRGRFFLNPREWRFLSERLSFGILPFLIFGFLPASIHPAYAQSQYYGERKVLERAEEQVLPGKLTVQGDLRAQTKISVPYIDLIPTSTVEAVPGRVYFDLDDGKMYFYNSVNLLRSTDADSASASNVTCSACVDLATETSGNLVSSRVSGSFTAATITGGTFGSGNFTFPSSAFVTNTLGVGTTSPQATLEVAGTLAVSGVSASLPSTTTVGGTQVVTEASDYGRSGVASTLYEGATALSLKYALQATTITGGTGLSGGGSLAANRTISADSTYLQRRVSGSCSTGSAISVVNLDGTVGCEVDDVGATGSGTINYVSKWTGSTSLGNSIVFDNGSNIGIGTTAPAYKLDVTGDIRATGTIYGGFTLTGDIDLKANKIYSSLASGSFIHAHGFGVADSLATAQTNILPGYSLYVQDHIKVGGNIKGAGADVAENFEVASMSDITTFQMSDIAREENAMMSDIPEPGDVVVSAGGVKIAKSQKAYDSSILGVVSTDPTLIMAEKRDGVPVAIAGTALVKVVGSVKTGDLLTTSAIPGYAMKLDRSGPSLGKALDAVALDPSHCIVPDQDTLENEAWLEDVCYRLRNGAVVGKVLMFVNLSW